MVSDRSLSQARNRVKSAYRLTFFMMNAQCYPELRRAFTYILKALLQLRREGTVPPFPPPEDSHGR